MSDFGILSLIPAIITIIVAITLKKVDVALFLGVVGGALVFARLNILLAIQELYICMIDSFKDVERVEIALFVLLVGGMLELISASGAYNEFAAKLSTKINSAKKARLSTFFLSLSLFFDDYANVLIAGSSMRNINIKHKVKPTMIAYIVNVLATFSSVMLISTWAAFEASLMVDAAQIIGIKKKATAIFFASVPFHFFTFSSIFLAFLVASSGKWFSYKLDKGKNKNINKNKNELKYKSHYVHVLIPILTLIISSILIILISGYLICENKNIKPKITNILGESPVIEALIIATILSITIIIIMFLKDKLMKKNEIVKHFFKGVKAMISISLVIMFAKGLSLISSKLNTGGYISSNLQNFISPMMLSAIIFLIALLISVATGFAWSSMAIVMPIAFQMAQSCQRLDLIPAVSAAVISGAIAGDQLIPYSDKTVMTAIACKIKPLIHAKTMIPQIIFVSLITFGAYIMHSLGVITPLIYLICAIIIFFGHKLFAR